MISENHVYNPTDLQLSRSTFDWNPTISGTCNAGRLIPTGLLWVQPGDSVSMKLQSLVKMSTPVYPTMDALYLDTWFFFVPFKFLLSRRYGSPSLSDSNQSWAAIIGAQDNLLNMPVPANGVQVPSFHTTASEYKPNSLLDFFPIDYQSHNNMAFSCLPLLAYFAIWNENFRDPNLMTPVTWSFDADNCIVPSGSVPLYATSEEVNTVERLNATSVSEYALVNALGSGISVGGSASSDAKYWLPFPVCRFHGYFGSLLPWPQRNTEGVELPLGDKAPVIGDGFNFHESGALRFNTGTSGSGIYPAFFDTSDTDGVYLAQGSVAQSVSGGISDITTSNMVADLSSATAANVNALRAAIQKQRWFEKLARSGNRYDELEYGLFGVRPHDSGDDRPRYLGGKRIPLAIEMVASTNGGTTESSSAGTGSLGSLGAFSHTRDEDHFFYESFDDWGVVMSVSAIRHHDTFGSGSDRFWRKRTRDDLYFPTFAHLGEQVTSDAELIDKAEDGTVLGYNPAWQEYRSAFDRVHGLLRPGQSLDFMTYARTFEEGTTLAQFLNASSQVATVDKTLAVSSNTAGFQFVYQFSFDAKIRRCMPTDSIPGLMDHF